MHPEIREKDRDAAICRLRKKVRKWPEVFVHTESYEYFLDTYLWARFGKVIPRDREFGVQDNISRIFIKFKYYDIDSHEKLECEKKIAKELFEIVDAWLENRY